MSAMFVLPLFLTTKLLKLGTHTHTHTSTVMTNVFPCSLPLIYYDCKQEFPETKVRLQPDTTNFYIPFPLLGKASRQTRPMQLTERNLPKSFLQSLEYNTIFWNHMLYIHRPDYPPPGQTNACQGKIEGFQNYACVRQNGTYRDNLVADCGAT